MFGFEKLEVWQVAIDFCNEIYSVTAAYPTEERFGLTNQTRRAAVSIAANIAEGSGRRSKKDFVQFTGIAYGSLMELVSHLRIAKEQTFVTEEQYRHRYERAERLGRMLSGLQASLESV